MNYIVHTIAVLKTYSGTFFIRTYYVDIFFTHLIGKYKSHRIYFFKFPEIEVNFTSKFT